MYFFFVVAVVFVFEKKRQEILLFLKEIQTLLFCFLCSLLVFFFNFFHFLNQT
jgi:hypothetical protein